MSLNTRELHILDATISSYIETGEPVGSKALSDGFDVSAATIRNELASLEKKGYLTQLHTSSGRVPTDKGYRLYVDALMQLQQPSPEHTQEIRHLMSSIQSNVHTVLQQLSGLMSDLIDYTTIVVTPTIYQETLKVAHLISLDIDRIMVVLLNSSGVNCEFLLHLDHQLNQEDLNKLSRCLTDRLDGQSIDSIDAQMFAELIAELPHFQAILTSLQQEIQKLNRAHQHHNVLTGGMSNMLKLPEFKNIELTQNVLATLEENKTLLELFDKYTKHSDESAVIIGQEHDVSTLQSCGMVLAPYKVNGQTAGVVSVLGPKRMAYPVIVPMVNQISTMITDYINEQEVSS